MWRNVFSWKHIPTWQEYRDTIAAFLKRIKGYSFVDMEGYEGIHEYLLHYKGRVPYSVAVLIDYRKLKKSLVEVWSSYVDHNDDPDECDEYGITTSDGDSYPHDTSNMKQFPIEDITSITAYINELARRRQ